jgi:predicted phage terminase large subunit-like protein
VRKDAGDLGVLAGMDVVAALVEWVAETCRTWGVEKLLTEGKASGITAAQELQRLYGREPWSVQLINPKSDKVARALAVQPLFANGQIYAPARDWSELVIEEMKSAIGQLGARRLNDLRKLDIRHDNALSFEPR